MPLLRDSFELIRVINLPDRKDRYGEMTQQLADLGMSFEPGKVELYVATRPTETAGFNSLGERGCFTSHLEILRDARDRGVESVLVLEDDVEVLPRDVEEIGRVAAGVAGRQWGFVYLGHKIVGTGVSDGGLVVCDEPLQTTHCYAVHRDALGQVVDYLESCLKRPPGDPVGGPMPVDGALSMFRAAHPEVVTLIAQPVLAGQRSSRSDITYRSFETIPGIKQAMGFARVVRRKLQGRG